MTPLVVLFAIAAGALFGLSVQIQKKGLAHVDEMTGTFVSVAATAALFWAVAPFTIDWSWWTAPAVLIFLACGLIFPAFGQRLQVAAVQRVGPALSSALGSFTPVFAVVPAVLFLGEHLNLQFLVGLALMIGGFVLAALGPAAFRGGFARWALLIPLGAALVRGIVQPVSKMGMAFIPSPVFASLVMATVSTFVVAGLLSRTRARAHRIGDRRGVLLFVLGGLANGLGILSLLVALSMGPVTTVAPLAAATPLWTLVFGALIFRSERLVWRHAAVAVLVVAGSVLIVTR